MLTSSVPLKLPSVLQYTGNLCAKKIHDTLIVQLFLK